MCEDHLLPDEMISIVSIDFQTGIKILKENKDTARELIEAKLKIVRIEEEINIAKQELAQAQDDSQKNLGKIELYEKLLSDKNFVIDK